MNKENGKLTLTDNDFYKLREDILNKLKENESSTNEITKKYRADADKKIELCEIRFNEINQKIEDLQKNSITYKSKVEKLEDLEKFKTSASDQIYTQNVKLINIQTELTKTCDKFDKMYLENIELPGTIGKYCKYKNLREYNEVSLLNKLIFYFVGN